LLAAASSAHSPSLGPWFNIGCWCVAFVGVLLV